MKFKAGIVIFASILLLAGCGFNENTRENQQSSSDAGDVTAVDKAFYDDVFNAKKLVLERNLQINIETDYSTDGQYMSTYLVEEFDKGKIRMTHPGINNEPAYNFMDASYNAETDTLIYDWYVRKVDENEQFLGYRIYHQEEENPNFDNITYSFFSLITDIPFESFSLKNDYYEATNIEKTSAYETLAISSFKVYFTSTFVEKIVMDGNLNEDGQDYQFHSTFSFSNIGKVRVELPTINA